jgi:hypothetical protein
MSATELDFTIFSDASLSGWGGAVLNEVSSRGPCTLNDKNIHISELELLAALNGLKSFISQVSNLSVRLMLDNITAVHYINKLGGTKSPALSAISADIVDWCEKRKLSIKAIHLPGVVGLLCPPGAGQPNESLVYLCNSEITSIGIIVLFNSELPRNFTSHALFRISVFVPYLGLAVHPMIS